MSKTDSTTDTRGAGLRRLRGETAALPDAREDDDAAALDPKLIETLIPDPEVARELGISLMGLWRWSKDKNLAAMGFPPKISVRSRNFRSRKMLEAFKARLIREALTERGGRAA
jgi:predicted DNA-binding transcriptional regulator AlpA